MKKLISIALIFGTTLVVLNCNKELKTSAGFNGAVAYFIGYEGFKTKMSLVNNDCEMFAMVDGVQLMIRKLGGKMIIAHDYSGDRHQAIINPTAPLKDTNELAFIRVSVSRWQTVVNNVPLLELDIAPGNQATIGFGNLQRGQVNTIDWLPAFKFLYKGTWYDPGEAYNTYNQIGGIEGSINNVRLEKNHIRGGTKIPANTGQLF